MIESPLVWMSSAATPASFSAAMTLAARSFAVSSASDRGLAARRHADRDVGHVGCAPASPVAVTVMRRVGDVAALAGTVAPATSVTMTATAAPIAAIRRLCTSDLLGSSRVRRRFAARRFPRSPQCVGECRGLYAAPPWPSPTRSGISTATSPSRPSWPAGPWSPHAQHGGAPTALLAGMLERFEPGPADFTARFNVELMRPVPLAPLRIERTVVRPGKKVQLVQGSLFADDVEVVRATVLRIRTVDEPSATRAVGPRRPAAAARRGGALPASGRSRRGLLARGRGQPRGAERSADRARPRCGCGCVCPSSWARRRRRCSGSRRRPTSATASDGRSPRSATRASTPTSPSRSTGSRSASLGGARLGDRSPRTPGSEWRRACSTTSMGASAAGHPDRLLDGALSGEVGGGARVLATARVGALAVVGLVAPERSLRFVVFLLMSALRCEVAERSGSGPARRR